MTPSPPRAAPPSRPAGSPFPQAAPLSPQAAPLSPPRPPILGTTLTSQPPTGLVNPGNTCYQNAALQVRCHSFRKTLKQLILCTAGALPNSVLCDDDDIEWRPLRHKRPPHQNPAGAVSQSLLFFFFWETPFKSNHLASDRNSLLSHQKDLATFLEFPQDDVDAHRHQDSQEFLGRLLAKLYR